MIIESGIGTAGFGRRKITIDGFRSSFSLIQTKVDGRQWYAIVENESEVVIVMAKSIHYALSMLDYFLLPMEQPELTDYVNVNFNG